MNVIPLKIYILEEFVGFGSNFEKIEEPIGYVYDEGDAKYWVAINKFKRSYSERINPEFIKSHPIDIRPMSDLEDK
jgi:lysozyme family protein